MIKKADLDLFSACLVSLTDDDTFNYARNLISQKFKIKETSSKLKEVVMNTSGSREFEFVSSIVEH